MADQRQQAIEAAARASHEAAVEFLDSDCPWDSLNDRQRDCYKAAAQGAIVSYEAELCQPFETAPKDGTPIEAWEPVRKIPYLVLWKKGDWRFVAGWMETVLYDDMSAYQPVAGTRWRPLSIPPGSEAR